MVIDDGELFCILVIQVFGKFRIQEKSSSIKRFIKTNLSFLIVYNEIIRAVFCKYLPKKKKKTDNETRTKRVSSLSESHMASG